MTRPFSQKRLLRSVLAALFAFSLLVLAPAARAQSPTINIPVALAPLDRTQPVELVAVTLDATLAEQDGHMLVTGTNTYKLHNADKVQQVEVNLGFPTWAGGTLVFEPDRMTKFQVFVDDKPARLTRGPGPALKYGTETRSADWYSWTLSLDGDQKRIVRVEFAQDLGDSKFPRFVFGMQTGSGWKGNVGSMRLSVGMPAPTTMEQFLSFDPFTPEFDGQTLTWRAGTFEPQSNESVTFVRPSDWAALMNRRAEAAQRDDDPNAHFALAQAYQELGGIVSTRQESFRALALAEMEVTVRLDPKNVAAREQLAQLYEARAGAAAGPRDSNYVVLAMQQWQALIGSRSDAEARRRLAEDSFFLAQEARKRGEYESALKLLDDARNYAPNGAGPLYTPDRMAAERKGARMAWARALAEQGDLAAALAQAREAAGSAFSIPAIPPLPTFVLTRAKMTTNSVERLIELRLVALPDGTPEADQAFQGIVVALQRANAATVTVSLAKTEHVISLRVPYGNPNELLGRLRVLSEALGDREDLATARAVLLPSALEMTTTEQNWSDLVHYRERLDFTNAQRVRQARLDALGQAMATLDKAKADDDAAQVQRAMVAYVRGWLQGAYAGGAAKVEFIAADNTRQEWTLNLSDARELASDHESLRLDVLLAFVAAGVALVVGLALLVFVFSRLVRRRPPAQSEE